MYLPSLKQEMLTFMKDRIVHKLIRFALIGGLGAILDFTCTWLFRESLGMNQYIANGIGFSVAVIHNFYLNKYWTFANKEKSGGKQFRYFLFFSLIGLGWNSLLVFLFTQYAGVPFYLSKCMAIALVFIWNFASNQLVTFRRTAS